jgi:hypothetical protein
MGLADYTAFKIATADFLHRGEVTAGSTVIDDCIDLAEAELNTELRCRNQEDYTATSATSSYLVHPSDWLAHKSISYTVGGREYDLQPYSEEGGVVQLGGSAGSSAQGFVVRGDKTYLLPTGSGTFQMVYYKLIPALSASATTNWLLTNYPHIYLGITLKYLAAWGYDDSRIPGMVDMANKAIASLNNASKLASYGQVPQARPDRYY